MPLINSKFHFRRGTAAQWAAVNPILGSGEPAWETDDGKGKIGDGATAYNSLPYVLFSGGGGGGAVTSVNGSTGIVVLNAASVGASATGHTHTSAGVTDFLEAVQDALDTTLVAGTNITLTYDDGTDTLTIAAAGGGGGGAVDSVNGQTGVVVLTAANVGAAATVHTHTSGSVTDWQEALEDGVGGAIIAGTNVTVAYSDVTGKTTINSTAQVSALTYTNAPAGDRFDVPGNPVVSTAARPNARTDIFFDWLTSDGLMPVNAIDGDNWLNAVEGP